MLAAFRRFAKSWVAALLMGVLIMAFAVWGIRRDVFTGHFSDAVITAGSRTVNSADFKREFDRDLGQLSQQMGQEVPLKVAVDNGFDREVLDDLANKTALAELLRRIGLQPSDKLVAQQIQKIPAFFDPVSGRFDKQAYQQRLADNGFTPAAFEQTIKDELSEQQLVVGIAGGLVVPRAYTAMAAVYGLEDRDVSLMVLGPNAVPAPKPPTDAQLTSFMKENAQALMRPEFRALSLVTFSPDQVLPPNSPVDPKQVQKQFDFEKDSLSKPETRSIDEIPAKDQATATQIAAQLQKGESAAAVAKAFGVEPITYQDKPQSAVTDQKIGQAAFQMKEGQTAAVQGDLGLAVVRVDKVTPGHQVTLDEVRPKIEAEVRKRDAANKIDQLTEVYDDAHSKGATLAEAAKKAGVPVVSIPPVAKQGVDQQGKPVAGLDPKVLDAAFSLPAGGESELIDAGNGVYFAVRVDKIIPPAMPSLAEIKPELIRAWMARDVAGRLKAKADELSARVKKGEKLQTVAASAGAKVLTLTDLNRQTAGQNQQIPPEVLGQAFAAKAGDVFTAQAGQVYVVGQVTAVRVGDPAVLARAADETRGQMSMAYIREMQAGAEATARQEVKVKIDAARARAALGLEPDTGKPGQPGPAQ
ncbi:MAG: SurA N-terminal domain-containing protein [Alphaproteobacteria bacterium]|nr:SurA N-terminal domain-containing protein [Alphaproteobacteria bacterium]